MGREAGLVGEWALAGWKFWYDTPAVSREYTDEGSDALGPGVVGGDSIGEWVWKFWYDTPAVSREYTDEGSEALEFGVVGGES